MDPVSQGVLGATVALLVGSKDNARRAAVAGACGGMAPDLDIIFQSSTDPLLALELHRQFTHSLVFIPCGGVIVGLFLWALFYRKQRLKDICLFATAGYATHGLLDACTSYGTQLLWPFSDYRVAWDIIGIIDPVVTLPLLIGVIAAAITQRKRILQGASMLVGLYFCFGLYQHNRAMEEVYQLAAQAGRPVVRAKAMPTIGNLIVWRTLYESNGRYYVNALALPLFSESRVYPGGYVTRLDVNNDFPNLNRHSVQAKDIERFRWFTDNWLFVEKDKADAIGDLRYASPPDSTKSLWHIVIDAENPQQHVDYKNRMRENSKIIPFDMLFDE